MSGITVIVPIYNVEKYIAKCLDSLINQTYSDIEIYAINDGSTDNSGNIVKEYAKIDKRINYIEKENGGYGSVLEFAISKISSEYFLICDPDDWLEKDALEYLYSLAIKNNVDIVIGEKYLVYNDSSEIKFEPINCKFFNLKNEIVEFEKLGRFSLISPSPHSKLFRTSIAKNIKFPCKVSYTDFLLYMISLQNAKRIIYTKKALSFYLIDRPGNSMTDKKPKAVKDLITVWHAVYNQSNKDDGYILYRLYEYFIMIMSYYKKNSNNIFKDDLFEDINNIRKILDKYYKKFKKIYDFNLEEKLKLLLLFEFKIPLKFYIRLKKN